MSSSKNSGLEKVFYSRKFVPYNDEEVSILLLKMLKLTPRYVRVMRIMREIPKDYLVAGLLKTDLRKEVEDQIRKNKIKLKEIRFREIGFAIQNKEDLTSEIKLKTTKYSASNGKEFFVEAINKNDVLFGLLRLRLDKKLPAMIRELHVYGPALSLGEKGEMSQHKGLGKQLMAEAEKIANKFKYKQIQVISGVGVREYYRNLGYVLEIKTKFIWKKSYKFYSKYILNIMRLKEWHEVIGVDYPPVEINDRSKQYLIDFDRRGLINNARAANGHIYTSPEYERRREKILYKPLS